MSFAGSLILTALGGVYYKISRDQIFQQRPVSKNATIQDVPNLYQQQVFKMMTRATQASTVFLDDMFSGNVFMYPFKGVNELFANFRTYSTAVVANFVLYLVSFTVVSMVYWATITPVYTALFIFAGPIGVMVAAAHSLLHANMLTTMFLRVSHANESLVESCVNVNGYRTLFKSKPIRYVVSPRTTYFWVFYLPKKTIEYLTTSIAMIILLGISAIPLVGPFMFNLLSAPVLSRVYFSKMLRLRGLDNNQRFEKIFEHPGQYVAFGITAGFLDNIPIIAGISVSSNTLGATLLGIDDYIITR